MKKNPISPRTPKYPKYSEVNNGRSNPSTPNGIKSPRLQLPAYETPQTRKDVVSATFVSVAGQKLKSLPPSAKNKHVIALNLEDNQLSINSLKDLPKNLTSLSLSNNPLLSCAIPKFDRLRSLVLDNCQINSFEGMPKFPNLRLFSIANNNISDLNEIQIFTKLETLNLSNNAFDFDPVICIAAIGSICLTKFNGIPLTSLVLSEAFKFSPIVGYALRHGRNPQRYSNAEEEIQVSQEFLNKNLIEQLTSAGMDPSLAQFKTETVGDNMSLILPFTATNIKWYRDVLPTEQNTSEWASVQGNVSKDTPNVLELTNIMKMHLIKCDFTMNEQNFSLYTDQPIGRKPNVLVLPFPLDPVLAGLPLEGSMISLIPLPIPTKVAWVSGTRIIKQDETAIIVSNAEIGKPVTCLLAPFCPNFPNIIFATLYTETMTVQPLLPTVSGVTFPEIIIEESEIEFTRVITPDREGNSQISIEHSRFQSSAWENVANLSPDNFKYTPNQSDVGCYLRICYTPETSEGTQGETIYFYSKTKVLPQFPTFENAAISGQLSVGHTLVATGKYKGGHPGQHHYRWLLCDNKDGKKITQKMAKTMQEVGNEKFLKITQEMEDKIICLEILPIRDDEVVGNTIFLVSQGVVQPAEHEELRVIEYNNPIVAGKKVQLEETVQFFLSSPDSPIGYEPIKFGNSFVPHLENVGQFLRVESEGAEGLLGEVQEPPPLLKAVAINCEKCVENAVANLQIKVQRLSAQNIEIIWTKVKKDTEKVVAVNTSSYTFAPEDVGFQIRAKVTALDKAGNAISSLTTDLTQTVQAQGNSVPVIAGKFKEGGKLHIECEKEYSEVLWFRKERNQWINIGVGNEYTVSSKDIGSAIRCQMKIGGNQVTVTSREIIDSGLPTATIEAEDSAIEGQEIPITVTYNGGKEGKSECKWERIGAEDVKVVVANNTNTYQIKKQDVNSTIELSYCPPQLKEGSAVAHSLKSAMDQIDPEKLTWTIEKVTFFDSEILAKDAKSFSVPADAAGWRIMVTATNSSKIKSPSKFAKDQRNNCTWTRVGNARNTVVVSKELKYVPTLEDVGHELKFSYKPVRKDGVTGETVTHEFGPVVAADPSISDASFTQNSDGFLEVKYKYTGGVEGNTTILYHIKDAKGQLTLFAKSPEKVICPHPDLYNKEVVVDVIPTRDDNVKGQKTRVGSVIVKPRPTVIDAEIKAKNGEIKPGNILKCFTKVEGNGELFYRWYRSTDKAKADDWELIEGEEKQEFTPRDIDSGYFIRCTLFMKNSEGWESDIFETITPKQVDAAPVRVSIAGGEQELVTATNLTAKVTDKGQELENVNVVWQRRLENGEYVDIAEGNSYLTTANDIGRKIRCLYGKNVFSNDTNAVSLSGKMKSMVNAVVRTKNFKFVANASSGNSTWTVQVTDSGLSMKSKLGNEKSGKWTTVSAECVDGTKDEIKLTLDVSTSFVLVPVVEEERILSAIGQRNVRDFVACVINGFSKNVK